MMIGFLAVGRLANTSSASVSQKGEITPNRAHDAGCQILRPSPFTAKVTSSKRPGIVQLVRRTVLRDLLGQDARLVGYAGDRQFRQASQQVKKRLVLGVAPARQPLSKRPLSAMT